MMMIVVIIMLTFMPDARSFAAALAHVRSGRIESLGDWLSPLQE